MAKPPTPTPPKENVLVDVVRKDGKRVKVVFINEKEL